MSLDIAAINATLDAVTPGPWETRDEVDGYRAGRRTVVWAHGKRVLTVDQTRPHHDHEAEANAAFTAAARTLVPSLLAEIDRLHSALHDAEYQPCPRCGVELDAEVAAERRDRDKEGRTNRAQL